ncbi:hypothetical protein CWO85_02630 [Candidatus Phytoplasma ziziphi]|uniref:Uncharacterized protein n=1 Tax=Ziziphus jujuba witches'-broom phytoplasma TaxID=135727 RepID=A0A660HMZ8_ZIZJU|nr:hypothetical protein [Candidatus Phytoplasma ziziphi]AYJ01384.1 hypothetical protein CWO85_02630 [Candidatus Phytoplasma ziziphi]
MIEQQLINTIFISVIGVLILTIIFMKTKKEKISLSTFQNNKKKIKNYHSEIINKKIEIQTLMKNIFSLDINKK